MFRTATLIAATTALIWASAACSSSGDANTAQVASDTDVQTAAAATLDFAAAAERFDPPVDFDVDIDAICDQDDPTARAECLVEVYTPLLDEVYATAMAAHGREFRPVNVLLEFAETACGMLYELVYCTRDDTIVLPIEEVSRWSERGLSAALDRVLFHPAVQEYITAELTEEELTTVGAYSAVVAFTHEYGHHVQNMLGTIRGYFAEAGDDLDQRIAVTRRLELEADCMAGWFAGYLVRLDVHIPTLLDNWAAIVTLTGIGDDLMHPSIPPGAHGLIEQRVGAWQEGITFGVQLAEPYGACVGLAEVLADDEPDPEYWDRSVINGCRLEVGAECAGVNLAGENLFGLNLAQAILSDADLFYSILTTSDLSGADLSGADLRLADLGSTDLSDADLSGANLSGANLFGARLVGADLAGADLSGATLTEVDLTGANLDATNFDGAEFSVTTMADGSIRDD